MASVNVELSDPELVAWLGGMTKPERVAVVTRVLRVGRMVVNFAQVSDNLGTLEDYFAPITYRMQEFTEALDRVIVRSGQSDARGSLGEEVVLRVLEKGNRHDHFVRVGARARTADLDVTFDVRGAPVAALLEVKAYSRAVPSSEVKKFSNDLQAQGRQFGLFVALGQRIQGFPHRLRIDESSGGLTMFLCDVDEGGVLLGYDMFKRLVERHMAGDRRSGGDRLWATFNAELDALAELEKSADEMERTAREGEEAARRTLERARSLRQHLSLALQGFRRRVRGEFDHAEPDLSATASPDASPAEVAVDLPPLISVPSVLVAPPSRPRFPRRATTPDVRTAWEAGLLDACTESSVDVIEVAGRWQLQRGARVLGTIQPDEAAPTAKLTFDEGHRGPLRKGEQFTNGNQEITIAGSPATFAHRLRARLLDL